MANRGTLPVGVHVTTHDRSQIEISIDYRPGSSDFFHTDLYFFLPRNLGVHSNSYSREQFYNDLINYLRFHTPIHLNLLKNEVDILTEILESDTTAQEREKLAPAAIQQVKLFANRANTLLKRLYDHFYLDGLRHESVISLKELYSHITFFREKFIKSVYSESLRMPSEVRQALLNSDEFISNRLLASCSDLLHKSSKNKDDLEFCSAALNEVLLQEKRHRKSLGDLYVDVGTLEREREYFYFRHSVLKKEIAQPLYIDKKSAKQERIYRNWVAGSGAALAGIWAQIADYQTHRFKGQKDFGLSMIGVGLLAIFVYVFKDRIKDISKEYINDKMKLFLPDYRSKLEFSEVEKNGNRIKNAIGKLSEYMRFASVKGIPEDIYYIRKLKGRRDIGSESQETVIHYHKSVYLESKSRIFGYDQELVDIKDIHRFNFSYFLNHLDDSRKQISVYDEDEGPARISAPKVYHVNVVSLVRSGSVAVYNHFRIILDKEGIVRMETVLPAFEMENREVKS